MRYPSLTWFEVSNLNITCDIPKYPRISCYLMVFVTLDWTFQPHCHPPTSSTVSPWPAQWKKHGCQTWQGGDGASHQQIAAAVGEAWEEGLQGPGHPTITLAQACTRVCLLHVCGRGYGGWFSHSTGRRSGRHVHSLGVAPVPTCSGPQATNPGYPGLSQFIWWYPWLTAKVSKEQSPTPILYVVTEYEKVRAWETLTTCSTPTRAKRVQHHIHISIPCAWDVYEVNHWQPVVVTGRLGTGGLALRAGLWSRGNLKARRGQQGTEVRRGVTRSTAAARQPCAGMNETFGMSTSEVISQDSSV